MNRVQGSSKRLPWILMSAMLLFWSHTRTLKAPNRIVIFRSITSLSEGEPRAAGMETGSVKNAVDHRKSYVSLKTNK